MAERWYAVEEVATLRRTVFYRAKSKPEAIERARRIDSPDAAESEDEFPVVRCRLRTMRRVSADEVDAGAEYGVPDG